MWLKSTAGLNSFKRGTNVNLSRPVVLFDVPGRGRARHLTRYSYVQTVTWPCTLYVDTLDEAVRYQEALVSDLEDRCNVLEIKEDGMQRVVDIKDIFYIEKRRNYSYIYLKDRRCVKVRKNLRDYEFELAGKWLVRVHAGYMVAMKYCAKIEKGQIVMEDGTEIPISRDRKNMVKEQFMISRRK